MYPSCTTVSIRSLSSEFPVDVRCSQDCPLDAGSGACPAFAGRLIIRHIRAVASVVRIRLAVPVHLLRRIVSFIPEDMRIMWLGSFWPAQPDSDSLFQWRGRLVLRSKITKKI